jgi:uncharacterized protein (TIRG00374 family)
LFELQKPKGMAKAPSILPHQRIIATAVIILGFLGVFLVILDWREVRQILRDVAWEPLLLAIAATAISYLSLSYGFAAINRIFGVGLTWFDLVQIGFASIALSHIVSSGGVAGYSFRFLTMRQRGVPAEDILAASLFHSYFNNIVMLALLPAGLIYLLIKHPLATPQVFGIGTAVGILVLLLITSTLILFVHALRSVLLRLTGNTWRSLTRRNIGSVLRGLDDTLARGMARVRRRPQALAFPIVLIVLDWTVSVVALGLCFDALGDPVGPGVLLTGFAIGITLGVLSMIPGGLGVQEGSMAGVYTLLGVSTEQALLAAVLFRIVYYLVPFVLSLGFYWPLLRAIRRAN